MTYEAWLVRTERRRPIGTNRAPLNSAFEEGRVDLEARKRLLHAE